MNAYRTTQELAELSLGLAPSHAKWLLDTFGHVLTSQQRVRGGDRNREMFEQRFVHRMTCTEVARVHQSSVTAVSMITRHALRDLIVAAAARPLGHREVRVLAKQIQKDSKVPL